MLACAIVSALMIAAPSARSIAIEFPTEVDLPFARTSPLKPLPITARWVHGDDIGTDGPELFVWVSFGLVDGWRKTNGVYRGEWQPPDPAFPGELQIVVSTVVKGAVVHSAMTASISAEIELVGRSEPDAEVEIVIGKESFGPVRAAHDGRFKVLVIVPPKTGAAIARSKDRLGNVNKKSVDLFVPKVSTLALACPFASLPAGGGAVPIAIVSAPEKAGKITVRAQQGRIASGLYTPPERFTPPGDFIEVTSALGDARCEVPLLAGVAVSVEAVLDPPFMLADGVSEATLTLVPRDRFGNEAKDVELALSEAGAPITLTAARTVRLVASKAEERALDVTVRPKGQREFHAPVVVHQIPDRGVRLTPVANGVRVLPASEVTAVTASDAEGNDVALESKDGTLVVAASARPKGHVLFTHVATGVSVLVRSK